jgi:peptide/nickel transport system substrate-binding protein
MRNVIRVVLCIWAIATLPMAQIALAAPPRELSVGLSSNVTSMDPHYHNLTPNNALLRHVFDSLISQDPSQTLIPSLATSWRSVDATTWEFKLRRNVQFHDGSPFTAEDVAFSFKRAPTVPNSPSSFAAYLKSITEIVVKDAHTILLKTATPYPLMPNDIATVLIISKKAAERATTEDFNSGKATIGTGPYTFGEYTPNQRVVLKANPA